jgi:hypothetical protein
MAEQEFFPKAFIAQGNGDLVKVTNVAVSLTNNGKQVHTLRQPGAGVTIAPPESEITFDFVIGETGFERDYVRDVQRGTIRQLRFKAPGGGVLTHNGIYTKVSIDGSLDDAVKGSCTFIGALEEQRQSLVAA